MVGEIGEAAVGHEAVEKRDIRMEEIDRIHFPFLVGIKKIVFIFMDSEALVNHARLRADPVLVGQHAEREGVPGECLGGGHRPGESRAGSVQK